MDLTIHLNAPGENVPLTVKWDDGTGTIHEEFFRFTLKTHPQMLYVSVGDAHHMFDGREG